MVAESPRLVFFSREGRISFFSPLSPPSPRFLAIAQPLGVRSRACSTPDRVVAPMREAVSRPRGVAWKIPIQDGGRSPAARRGGLLVSTLWLRVGARRWCA